MESEITLGGVSANTENGVLDLPGGMMIILQQSFLEVDFFAGRVTRVGGRNRVATFGGPFGVGVLSFLIGSNCFGDG
jgi:hypothetical protein